MSGGHFDYRQYEIRDIANMVEHLIRSNDYTNYGKPKGPGYGPETIRYFTEGLKLLQLAEIYVERIDWLVSGDDDEETFCKGLVKDVQELQKNISKRHGV